jgi:hypothetical protein
MFIFKRVKIVCDRKRGAQCGFSFITFEDQRDAEEAKDETHGKDFDGRAYVHMYYNTLKGVVCMNFDILEAWYG